MSAFIIADFDYEPYIKTKEHIDLFMRMKEIEPLLNQHVSKCYKEVEEFTNIHRTLLGQKLIKIIPYDGTKINTNPDLN